MDLLWLSLALGVVVAYGVWTATLNIFLSPLSHVPGPFWAKVTGKWLMFIDLAGHRTTTIHKLHKQYGPVVRIAPDEVSFASSEALRDIYSHNTKYMKGPVYDLFGRQGAFQMRDPDQHRRRQKRIAHVFAPNSLSVMEPLIHEQVRKLLAALDQRVGKPIDMLYWFRMLALDVVGELFLGMSFGALDSGSAPEFVHDLDAAYLVWSIQGQFPLIYRTMCALPGKKLQHFLGAGDRIYDYGANALQDYYNRHGRTPDRKDLLTKLIVGEGDKVTPLTDKQISVEITNLVFAATDTTGNTFTYLFFELARNTGWQKRVRAELAEVEFANGVPNFKSVAQLPVLDAIIQEALRIHPAAPASLQRIAPSSGGVIAGTVVPPNTIVSSQSYTTQREPSIFFSPDEFRPERWLTPPGGTDEMRDRTMVWGRGQRACLGKTMAMMELRIGTAAILKQFSVALASAKTVEDMEMTDHFTMIPKGMSCQLIFNKVKD